MNRTLMFGIFVFLAVVAVGLMGEGVTTQTAQAGHCCGYCHGGCYGCSGCHGCWGGCHGCWGCHGCSGCCGCYGGGEVVPDSPSGDAPPPPPSASREYSRQPFGFRKATFRR